MIIIQFPPEKMDKDGVSDLNSKWWALAESVSQLASRSGLCGVRIERTVVPVIPLNKIEVTISLKEASNDHG